MAQKKVSPGGALFALGLWLVVSFLPIFYGFDDVRLAFGLTGTPGKATVGHCFHYGSGKHGRTDCRGRFVPDDRAQAARAVKLPPESDVGETFRARLQPDGERARPTDVKGRLTAVALPALGLLFLLFLPWLLVHQRGWLGRPFHYLMGGLAGALAVTCVVGLVASAL